MLFIICYIVAAISLSASAYYTFRTASRYAGDMRRNMRLTGVCLVVASFCQVLLAFIRAVEMVMT